ncbi:hypothetical protein AQ915_25860 [Burkholderia pseudomallei]|nr:hypothetical protein AQ915_25860 [Burkholderia pseudomallei]
MKEWAMGLSGKAVGQQYLKALHAYLATTSELPTGEDGALNISEIAEKSGVPRQSFYKNPNIKAALEEARQSRSIPSRVAVSEATGREQESEPDSSTVAISDKKVKTMERRIGHLEQLNAALVAENAELRRQLKALRLQHGREDMVIETGRRIPTPVGHG